MPGDVSEALSTARDALLSHPLYGELNSPERVRIFMKHHVFAVWDFFSLLKRLQCEVTCVSVPWLPRADASHARFITEIVLAEECDESPEGGYVSHFELYLSAMRELGAERRPIEGFLGELGAGTDPLRALESAEIPETVRTFVGHTLRVATQGAPYEVAASFCHGRENLLADVLGSVQAGLGPAVNQAPVFKHYLDRHVTLDHDLHGPLAVRLLNALCDEDPTRLARADEIAVEAIRARIALWDGVLAEINAGQPALA
jgi:Protein of unknown function (DUF3050)